MPQIRAVKIRQRVLIALLALLFAADSHHSQQGNPAPDRPEPSGPDGLYKPLSGEGLHEGIYPEKFYKAVILRAPLAGGSDSAAADLPAWARPTVEGLRMRLEQHLDYLPHVLTEQRHDRITRYEPRLRAGDVPRPGAEIEIGATSQALEHAARAFAADFVFVLSFAAAAEDQPPAALAIRYARGTGIEAAAQFNLTRPEGGSVVGAMEAAAAQTMAGIAAGTDEEGNAREVPHAAVPPLVKQDKSLVQLAELRRALEAGELTEAWLAWEDLISAEPDCGRAALWGMEVFHELANRESDPELNADYKRRSIAAGIEALRHHPNDVMIRGRLCWNSFIFHARQDWALAGLDQALKVQPMHPFVIEWYTQVKHFWAETRSIQADWIREYTKDRPRHPRIELTIGNIYFGAGDHARGVEWLSRSLELAPGDHDTLISLGLCATYKAEQLRRIATPGQEGREARAKAREMYVLASRSLWKAIEIDPFDGEFAYDFYIRAVTHSYRLLPTGLTELDRVFLVWAARDGIASSSRTFQLDRLTSSLIDRQRIQSRRAARAAKPGDDNYELQLLARLRFSMQDKRPDETVQVLWQMRELGLRPDAYHGYMRSFEPLVNEYKPE